VGISPFCVRCPSNAFEPASDRLSNLVETVLLHEVETPDDDAVLIREAAGQSPDSAEHIDTIRRTLGLTHSGAVRSVDGLVAEGLIERRKSDRDARAIALWTTPGGERVASRVIAARAELLEPVLSSTSEADRKTIADLLETALAGLTSGRDSALSICRFCAEGVCRPLGCPVEKAVLMGVGSKPEAPAPRRVSLNGLRRRERLLPGGRARRELRRPAMIRQPPEMHR
jgi:DNA-binding MarR family transcriptional regulator